MCFNAEETNHFRTVKGTGVILPGEEKAILGLIFYSTSEVTMTWTMKKFSISRTPNARNGITLQQEKAGKIYQKDFLLKGQQNILIDSHDSLRKIYP